MFEKESKEYANKWLEHVKDLELQHKSDEKPEYIRILEAHQKGATDGYNKIKGDADKIIQSLLNIIYTESRTDIYVRELTDAESFLEGNYV